ncbi:COG3014 family protein [Shewanella sp. YIC-542]|uniref:COG3014 family protein n=1 Tax=Shewanella mytili TaxID=3377111 RepID=UPI00398E58E3
MKKSIMTLALATTLLSGCAGMMHQKDANTFDGALHAGDYQAASQFALTESGYDEKTKDIDDLLWGIEAGAALNYAGRYALSTQVLDAAENAMKDEDQEGVVENATEAALSILGNDAMMAYEQRQSDGVMLNTIKAWNFMFEGDFNNARVEWNRAEDRQRRAAEFFAEQIRKQQEEMAKEQKKADKKTTEFVNKTIENDETRKLLQDNGVTFDKWKPYDAFVNPYTTYSYGLNLLLNGKTASDFNKAADAFKRVYGLTDASQVKADLQLAQEMAKGATTLNHMVWVIFENGESAVKEEFRVDLPLFLLSDNVSYAGIALPRLKQRNSAYPHVEANGVQTEVVADMDKIIGAEFEKEYPMILTREITRTLVKTIAQKQLKDQSSALGLASGLFQLATTNADTRTFSALPKQFQTAHFKYEGESLTVKAGAHELPVTLDSAAQKHIVYIKATSAAVVPTVRVINI